MAESKLNQFIPVILGDPALKDQLRSATDADVFVQTVVRMGKERGYEFTADEVTHAVAEYKSRVNKDLTDADLARITGGASSLPTAGLFCVDDSTGWRPVPSGNG